MADSTTRRVKIRRNYETLAWKWMRYSGILLIPLAWGHMVIQDVLVGVHQINIDYVAMRWSFWGWRVYDFLLLAFTFAHGMNGLRQVLFDFLNTRMSRTAVSWMLFLCWAVITLIGAFAIIGGVKIPPR
jgi:succinate dehydrogenase / fumarate reductase, membrane anchor subunit